MACFGKGGTVYAPSKRKGTMAATVAESRCATHAWNAICSVLFLRRLDAAGVGPYAGLRGADRRCAFIMVALFDCGKVAPWYCAFT